MGQRSFASDGSELPVVAAVADGFSAGVVSVWFSVVVCSVVVFSSGLSDLQETENIITAKNTAGRIMIFSIELLFFVDIVVSPLHLNNVSVKFVLVRLIVVNKFKHLIKTSAGITM
jgi:hypothetical protein